MRDTYLRGRAWESVQRVIAKAKEGHRWVLDAFAGWLRSTRGLDPISIRARITSTRTFLDDVVGDQDVRTALWTLAPADVEAFFVRFGKTARPGVRYSMRTALRRFFLLVVERGWGDRHLAESVPSMRSYRLAGVPRGISDEQISQLFAAMPERSAADLRDRAIVALLAFYGVRSGQILDLRLEDIHWLERRIYFPAHKGGKPVVHFLVDQVAAALARYIKEVRPSTPFREVFLRSRPKPCTPLCQGAISRIVGIRLHRAGVATPAKGAHIFRHAFATRLLRAGQHLKAIADLLGQRHLDSAAIYAKLDDRALLEAAAEWPEVLR